jgi:hypothetical protein
MAANTIGEIADPLLLMFGFDIGLGVFVTSVTGVG